MKLKSYSFRIMGIKFTSILGFLHDMYTTVMLICTQRVPKICLLHDLYGNLLHIT